MSEPSRYPFSPRPSIRGRRSPTCSARSHRTSCPGAAVGGTTADARDPARHHGRRDPLRRRRGDGRRPPGDRGLRDRQPPHREGVPGRRLLRRRDRRRGRSGGRDGEAVPGAARALREGAGRRRSASKARPTSSASSCAPTCPPRCRASSSCRCSPGYDTSAASAAACSPTTSPAAATRSSTSRRKARAASTPATGSRRDGARA